MFRARSRESLNETSFHTRGNNVDFDIYINKLGSEEEPVNPGSIEGEPAASGTMPFEGYHTIALRNPVELEEREYFSVILKLNAKKYPYAAAVETAGEFIAANTVTTAGKSYFAMNESVPAAKDWVHGECIQDTEGNNKSSNACIRILTVTEGTPPAFSDQDSRDSTDQSSDNTGQNSDNNNMEQNDSSGENGGGSGGGGGCSGASGLAALAAVSVYFLRRSRE